MPAKFIVVEACDGCGKTTLIKNVAKLLQEREGITPLCLKEPFTELEIGQFVRGWVDHTDFSANKLKIQQALNLFLAARAEMLEKYILPRMPLEQIILCDRFALSTMVYQSMNPEWKTAKLIKESLELLKDNIHVDQTFYLELSLDSIIERLSKRNNDGGPINPMDNKSKEWFAQILSAYRFSLQNDFPKELIGDLQILDAEKSADNLAEEAYQKIKLIL